MPVVKSITNDLRIPADAEWVIEGYLGQQGYAEPEGPYGEFLGYYGGVKTNPVFHVTAVTHRRDALFQTLTIGGATMSCTDTAQLACLRTEVLVWRALETAIREPVAVYAPPATGGTMNVRIAMRQRVAGEARNAIMATFGSHANVKNVFVVDPDIDIFSDQQMEWALATRFQPDRDLVVESGFRTLPLDPSLGSARTGAKAGYDLTLLVGGEQGLESEIPQPPRFEGRRFESVEAALRDGPKYFENLMAAVGSEDGREIVLALERLERAAARARAGRGTLPFRLKRRVGKGARLSRRRATCRGAAAVGTAHAIACAFAHAYSTMKGTLKQWSWHGHSITRLCTPCNLSWRQLCFLAARRSRRAIPSGR